MIQKGSKPNYELDELLNQCDPDMAPTSEDQAWLKTPSSGRELI